MRSQHAIGTIALVLASAACTEGNASVQIEREMDGDTLVVRTVSGGVWADEATLVPEVSIGVLDGAEEYIFGSVRAIDVNARGEIYVLDGQVPAVRVYDAAGAHLRTVGRSGEGPGEFASPDGMVLLSDGRLVVRDPRNTRFQVFDADLNPSTEWRVVPGGFSTSDPVRVSFGDTVLTQVLMDRAARLQDWRFGLMRIAPDGSVVDTLALPDSDYDQPTLFAQHTSDSGTSSSASAVPFSADEIWQFHPDGFFVFGVADEYRFTLLDADSLRRFERVVDAVRVTSAERSAAETRATANMRGTDPEWRWTTTPIPSTKPPYKGILTGRDGRIWLAVSMPGREIENPDYDPSVEDSEQTLWVETTAFDVFESDGTFLGRVTAPDDFRSFPTPIMDGDLVWATWADDLGVVRVARYRIQHGPAN